MIDAVLDAALEDIGSAKQFDKIKLPLPPFPKLKLEKPLTLREAMKITAERKTPPLPPREEPTEHNTTMEAPDAVDISEHVLPSIKMDQETARDESGGAKPTVRSPALRKTYLFSPTARLSSPSMQLLSEHHNSSSPSRKSSSAKKDKEAKRFRQLAKWAMKKEKQARKEEKHKAARSG